MFEILEDYIYEFENNKIYVVRVFKVKINKNLMNHKFNSLHDAEMFVNNYKSLI